MRPMQRERNNISSFQNLLLCTFLLRTKSSMITVREIPRAEILNVYCKYQANISQRQAQKAN